MKIIFSIAATISLALVTSSASRAAVTTLQTIDIFADSNGTFVDLDGEMKFAGVSSPLNSFTKFDPSLGSLTEILITSQVGGTLEVKVESSTILNSGSNFSLQLEDSGDGSYSQVSVVYFPTGDVSGYTVTAASNGFGTVGGTDVDPSSYLTGEDFYYSASNSTSYGGSEADSILITDLGFNPSDFIGIGNVTGLEIGNFVGVNTSSSTIDNLGPAFLDITVGLEAGTVTLQYVYVPVPEPSLVSMIGLLAGITCLRRRNR